MTPGAEPVATTGSGEDGERAAVPRGTDRPRTATAPPPPAVATEVFGADLDRAVAYADLLATAGVERGLLGPREVDRLWTRHLLNCAVVAPVVPAEAEVLDVGSGAGLPGIVLALVRPDLRVRLVEPLLRRATFLTEAVEALGLDRVDVVRARAETLAAAQPAADVVTARAVAPLDRLVTWCAPLVRVGGEVVALKGGSAEDELTAAGAVLDRYDAREVRVEVVGAGVVEPPTRIVRFTVGRPTGPAAGRARARRPARRRYDEREP